MTRLSVFLAMFWYWILLSVWRLLFLRFYFSTLFSISLAEVRLLSVMPATIWKWFCWVMSLPIFIWGWMLCFVLPVTLKKRCMRRLLRWWLTRYSIRCLFLSSIGGFAERPLPPLWHRLLRWCGNLNYSAIKRNCCISIGESFVWNVKSCLIHWRSVCLLF